MFFKQLFCFHYFEEHESMESNDVELYMKFLNKQRLACFEWGKKAVVCNACGKMKIVDKTFIDIKRIN